MDEKKMLNDEELSAVQGGTQIPVIIKSGDTLGALAKKLEQHPQCRPD